MENQTVFVERTNLEIISKVTENAIPKWALELTAKQWNQLRKRAPNATVTDVKNLMNAGRWNEAKGIWDRYVTGKDPSFRTRKGKKGKGKRRGNKSRNKPSA